AKIILIGSSIDDSKIKIFQCNNKVGIDLAFRELISKGKNKIAYLGGNNSLLANEERFYSYKNCLEKYNLNYNEQLVVNLDNIFHDGYKAVSELLVQTKEFDSIVCFNDTIALGAIQKLKELNYNIPKDVAIIGFDDIPFAKLGGIELTTLKQPIEKMAKDCIEYFSNKSEDYSISLYSPKLIIRKTT
ncbi:MAG: LacI family DNA-binding transcriptional regulator, partial [Fusobacteriaceae bacterium]